MLPALLLKTTAAQITAIGWLNAVYMASAVFPAYALARAMGMNRRRTAFLVGVTAVLPTMSAASTFMSETVFLPLSLWLVYFFLRAMLAEPKARVGWCAAAGAFCYLLYLNKEVARYYLIAWVLVRAWVWWHDKASWRAELACIAALLGSFLVCFLLAKATLFRGLGNSYNQTGWLTAEQWRFLPFALVCDALFAVLAFWVFPVLLPLCGLHRPRRGSDARRTQLPLFLLLSLGIGVAVIAWSITVREDLGSPSPRQHTRYLEPLLFPLLTVTLDTLDEKLTKTRRRILAVLTIAWGVLFVTACRAIGAGAGDNTLLQWFDFVADRTDRLPVLGQGAWLRSSRGDAALASLESLNPFFLMLPGALRPVAVILSALAAVIASQALITGSYTLVSEAIRLDLMPHLKVLYPAETKGQIYIDTDNKIL